MNLKIKKRIFITYILAVFVGMLVWNLKTPLMNDDLYAACHSFITTLKDGFSDYFYWSGRFWGQSFFRLTLIKGQGLSSVINAALFSVFLVELLYITNSFGRKYYSFTRIFGVSFFALVFIPGFVSVFIWRAGAGNYMDPMIFYLAFLILLLKGRFKNNKILYYTLLVLTGFIAGWGNENTSGGLILISILLLVKDYLKNGKISKSKVTGVLFAVFGYLLLIFSPGNQVRLRSADPEYLKEPFLVKIINGSKMFIHFMFHNPFMVAMIVIDILIAYFAYTYWKKSVDYWLGIIFILGGLASILVMIVSPEGVNESRTYAGGYLFLISGMWYLVPINWTIFKMNKVWLILLTLCIVLCLGKVSVDIHKGFQFSNLLNDRYTYIEHKKKDGRDIVRVEPIHSNPYNNYSLENSYIDLTNSSQSFPNIGYERYFNIGKVSLR